MFIECGATLDKPYLGMMMGRTARQKIKDHLFFTTEWADLMRGEGNDIYLRIVKLQDQIEEALSSREIQTNHEQKQASRKKKASERRQQRLVEKYKGTITSPIPLTRNPVTPIASAISPSTGAA